jgi:glycosyltransferase involved in cell wall biosynthesis
MGIRILHVATRHRVGGAERNLLHTVSRELERGFDVHVAVGTSELRADFPPGVRLHALPDLVRAVSPSADRRALRSIRRLVRANRFDVVHTHQSKAGALGRAAARGLVPVVLHTVHMSSFGPAYGRTRSAVFRALERWLAGFTDKLIFVGTDLQRRYLRAGIGSPDRCVIVRSPIPNLGDLLELRHTSADQRRRARAALGIPNPRDVILSVAALDRRKRHDLAIKSLAPLLAGGQTQLLIAGEGLERSALERLCDRLGVRQWVRFMGFVADVKPLYAAADVLVQTSALEGVPQTVAQAVAAGVPVVATEVDGLCEVVSDSHVTVLPPDGRHLLDAVRAALAAPAPPPAPAELVRPWLPESVDRQLAPVQDWLEAYARQTRPTPDARSRIAAPANSALPADEPVPAALRVHAHVAK